MKVTLIDYTGNGNPDKWHAANILIFTKQTRLEMSPSLLSDIVAWPEEKKMTELEYMANTIPSSWEFIDYTFMVEKVTRAFTHQFVRSRQWSFAQQTMRVLNVSGWEYGVGPSIVRGMTYDKCMEYIAKAYDALIEDGAKIEDARGILPTNILTNIVGKCNMRTFVETIHKRQSPRTQDEYRAVMDAMKAEVLKVQPWMHLFLDRTVDKAIADLQRMIEVVCGQLSEDLTDAEVAGLETDMTKKLDQIRMKL